MDELGRTLQGGTVQIDLDHVTANNFHCFLDGGRHFTRPATTEANATLATTHRSQCGESEGTATLHGSGDAVDLNQLLDVAFVALLLVVCHNPELQFAFMSGVSQRLHTVVVLETRVVERHLGDAGRFDVLGDQLTNLLGCIDVAGGILA